MLASRTMDVLGDDERVQTGLDAPKNKNDSITMSLNNGLLTFGSKDQYFFFSTRLEDMYAVVVSLAMTDRGAKQLQIRGLDNKRKHDAETRDEMLWAKRKFTDAEIHCGGKQFPVHKAIVAAHGSCFERMFDSGMSEAQDGIVVIHDANSTTLGAVLQYLYLTTIPNDVDMVDLFALAQRFNIQGLVVLAGERMLSCITVDNIHETATMLRRHMHDPPVACLWEDMVDMLGHWDKRGLLSELLVQGLA